MQGCKHGLCNRHKDVELQDCYLPMTEEGGSDWLMVEGKVMQVNNK